MAEVDWEARKKQKAMLTELLTRHLLTLDSIQAVGGETPPEVDPPFCRAHLPPPKAVQLVLDVLIITPHSSMQPM